MTDRDFVSASKFLSLILRHEPGRVGLTLDAAGWVEVSTLLDALRLHRRPLTPQRLREIVERNDKKRFAFSDDGRRIRASQGHSVEVELGYTPQTPPDELFHGTARRRLGSILTSGLLPMRRAHVHLSADIQTALAVGRRHGAPVVLSVHAGAMRAAGHAFFLSANGVWLTAQVPPEFLAPRSDDFPA